MDLELVGRRAIVTGSTAGIGLATARLLAAEGAKVVVNGRTAARVEEAVGAIVDAVTGAEVRGVAADLGTASGCETLIREVPDADILVNNVGIFAPQAFGEISDADWLRFFEVNVLSGVRLSRHYMNGMRARDWGRIVFVSSESAVQIPVEMIHYGMTKTAQLSIARGLAETLSGTGVTVNSVLPGPDGIGGRGDVRAAAGGCEGDRFRGDGEGVLLQRASVVAAAAVRHLGRGGFHDRLPLQRARQCDDRRGAQGGWRGGAGDSLAQWACPEGIQNASTLGRHTPSVPSFQMTRYLLLPATTLPSFPGSS